MIRITLVSLWPTGGMLHYVARLSSALAARTDLEVTVVLPFDADTYLFSKKVTLRPVRLPSEISLRGLLRIITGVPFAAIYRTIKSTRPQVVHINSSHPLLIPLARILAWKYCIVATVHDAISHPGVDDGFRKRLERKSIIRVADRIFVHRQVIREQLVSQFDFVDPSSVLVSPHGDYDFFAEFSSEVQREHATLLFFGRISVYKGLSILVRAVDIVRDSVPNLRVIIAGSGQFEKDVAEKLGNSVYEIHNRFIDDDEVAGFFRRATVVVLPYIEASESGVVRIAQAFGRPVISTRVGGIPESVRDGQTGLIVEPADVDGLADAIKRLLLDADLRQRLDQEVELANQHRPGWDDAADIIRSSYKDLIAQKS